MMTERDKRWEKVSGNIKPYELYEGEPAMEFLMTVLAGGVPVGSRILIDSEQLLDASYKNILDKMVSKIDLELDKHSVEKGLAEYRYAYLDGGVHLSMRGEEHLMHLWTHQANNEEYCFCPEEEI